MLTLGIHDGHTATACVMEDGEVVACISEERLNRKKEWYGFPELSIRACLELAGKAPEEVDAVGVCSLLPQIGHAGYLRPSWPKRAFGALVRVAPSTLLQREGNVALAQSVGRLLFRGRRRHYERRLTDLGLLCPWRFHEHHLLHAATAYYTNWNRKNPCLVLTLDGSGDAVAGTVQVGEGGKLRRVASIFNYNSPCELYTRVTQYLGMQPMSHEYKVMGMAPYADERRRSDLAGRLRALYRVPADRPLQIVNDSGHWKWQLAGLLDRLFAGERFDVISGAVQDAFEDLVLEWVRNAIRVTGVRDLALSGGGFMNVKLNGRILALPEVESLFVFPSCGDESNPVGAAILAALGQGFAPEAVQPLGMVDWGPAFTSAQVRAAVEARLPRDGFRVSVPADVDAHVGREVAAGRIVGRLAGRMEWGARALGNRSILADPRSPTVIHRINKAIKMRDFWMPFAPAVLAGARDRYLRLRPDYRCPFMAMACETTEAAHRDLPAALHPFDQTARPEVVDPAFHPRFHRLIEAFQEVTGTGAVLNTSFNIHGEPIVCSPEDAIHTLLGSDLDAVQVEDHYVERVRG